MLATDSKMREINAADAKTMLRIVQSLAELSTRQVAENTSATGIKENKKAAKIGGNISKRAREDFEERTGQKVVTDENYLPTQKKAEKY